MFSSHPFFSLRQDSNLSDINIYKLFSLAYKGNSTSSLASAASLETHVTLNDDRTLALLRVTYTFICESKGIKVQELQINKTINTCIYVHIYTWTGRIITCPRFFTDTCACGP